MAKEKTLFACTACGYETSRWVGRCPGCGAWNTMVESAPIVTGAPTKAPKQRPGTGASAMLLREIPEDVAVRSSTGISELDRVLGGGIVEGALMLIGGDPGIGKSTLLLQVCANLCKTGKRVLYVSGEESAKQLKLRANRLGITSETLYVLAENALDNVEEKLRGLSPDVAVIDSIQTMYRPDMASAPGSVSQIRECTSQIMRLCKERIILINAPTGKSALATAKRRGKSAQHNYKNDAGGTVYFEFIGVMDLLHLGVECEADEVWYNITQRKLPMERAASILPPEDKLSAIRNGL